GEELLVDTLLLQDPPPGDATLPGVRKAAGHRALRRVLEVRIVVNDDAGVATQLERDALFASLLLESPAHFRAAGESELLEAVVADQRLSVAAGERQHVERARRPARVLHNSRQQQR